MSDWLLVDLIIWSFKGFLPGKDNVGLTQPAVVGRPFLLNFSFEAPLAWRTARTMNECYKMELFEEEGILELHCIIQRNTAP